MTAAAVQRTPTTAERLTAAEWASMLRDPIKDKRYQETPIGDPVRRYLRTLAFEEYADQTLTNREQVLAKLCVYFIDKTWAEMTFQDLDDYTREEWAHLARNTKASYVSYLKVFSRWAHDNDFSPTDPARKLRAPRQADTMRRSHPASRIRRLVLAQESRMHQLCLLILYWCGLRRNELRNLQWCDIDLEGGFVSVLGKGKRLREITLHDEPLAALRKYADDNHPKPTDYLLHKQWPIRRGAWPLYSYETVSRPHERLSTTGVDKWWQRCVRNAGLEHFPMHELRHTIGTHFQEAGHDIFATQQHLGHASIATTERIYLHVDKRAAVERVQRMMGGVLAEDGE